VHLHTEIYAPKNAPQPLPFIFERTPYGVADDEKESPPSSELRRAGFGRLHLVFQDIRGRYNPKASS